MANHLMRQGTTTWLWQRISSTSSRITSFRKQLSLAIPCTFRDFIVGLPAYHDMTADPAWEGRHRGAKTAMTVALDSPELMADLVAVDNAPVDAMLGRKFAEYIRGMKKIESAGVTRQAEADDLLKPFEEVRRPMYCCK